MNIIYAIGTTIGLPALGIVLGLCSIHLWEASKGNSQGPIYTALTNPKAGFILGSLAVIAIAGLYSLIVDFMVVLS